MWKQIKGYEGYYEVSNTGNVRSVERYVTRNDGVVQLRKSVMKALVCNQDGYLTVSLSRNGLCCRRYVHRLVYEAFVGNIPDGYEVNHKDFDRKNNFVGNLEIVSHADNVKYTYDAGRHYVSKTDLSGSNNPNFGNHILSERYRSDPELSRKKQGRKGLQNGRCRMIRALFPDNSVMEYGCVKHCAEDLITMGVSRSTPQVVYQGIWNSVRKNTTYKGVRFEYM